MTSCITYINRQPKPFPAIQSLGKGIFTECLDEYGENCGDFDFITQSGAILLGSKITELVVMHLDTHAPNDAALCDLDARGGWWADWHRPNSGTGAQARYGSRLWLLRTAKASNETLRLAIFYAQEAMNKLAPFIGAAITVTGELAHRRLIVLQVEVKGPKSKLTIGYSGTHDSEWLWRFA